jgi:hypothetical protein
MEKTIKVLGINPKSTNESNIIPSEIIIRQELTEKLEDFPEWFIDYIIQKSTDSNVWDLPRINKPTLNLEGNLTNLVPVLIKRALSFSIPVIKLDFVSKGATKGDHILESNIALDAVNTEFVNYRIASNDLTNVVGLYIHMLEKNAVVPVYKNNFVHFRDDCDIKSIANSGLYGWVDDQGKLLLVGPSSNSKIYSNMSSKYIWNDLTIKGLELLTKDMYKMVLWSYRNATIISRVYITPWVERSLREFDDKLNFDKLANFWSTEIIQHITMDKPVLDQLRRIFPIPKNKESDIMYLSSIYNLNSLVESIYMYGLSHPKNKDRLQLLEDTQNQINEVTAQRKMIFKIQLRMIYATKYAEKLFGLPYDKLNASQQSKIQKQLDTLDEYEISSILSKVFTEMRLVIINFYNDKSAIVQIKKKLESIFNTKTTINDMYPLKKTVNLDTVNDEYDDQYVGGKGKTKTLPKTKTKIGQKAPIITKTLKTAPAVAPLKDLKKSTKTNTSIGILCPHWLEYIDAILSLKPQQQHKESTLTVYDVNDARDPIVKKWGADDADYTRNEGRWCKTCGEKLQEITEESIATNNQEFWSSDNEDNHIQQIIWSELQNSIKFLKFSSSQEDPFRIVDYLITVLTPYLKNVYLEIQKNKTLNENESKAYLTIYASMYVYSALAKLIIENPNMNWNIVVKKSRNGGGETYLAYNDMNGSRYTPYIGGGSKDNKLIITQAYSIVLSVKKSLIDNITGMSMEKFKALFLEIFNAVYSMDGITITKVTETFAETSKEPDNKYNYILGLNPIYHYAYQEAVLYSGKTVDYVDLMKIVGTDTPRKWSLMNSTKKAEILPIYKHPMEKDPRSMIQYEDIFNLSRMYEVDKFETLADKAKLIDGGKAKAKIAPKAKAKNRTVQAKTAPKKKTVQDKSTVTTTNTVTNNAFELYVDFFKDEIYKEYLHADSKPLMVYYEKVELYRKNYEQVYDVMKYLKFLPPALYNKPYNNTFKQVNLKEKALSAADKATRKKSQAFSMFHKYCPFFLPKKQGHVYKSVSGKELLPHESELDYLKPSKCMKCGWEKLFIEDQPDTWYKKWTKKMLPKKNEIVNIFNRKDDTYKWENSDKFPIWKVNTMAILKLSKISGLSNNFWDNLGFMEEFEFEEITAGKKNPSKSISDDRLDKSEQSMLLDRIHKIDNHVMWIYIRLMNVKYFNSMTYEDTLNDPTLTEILKKNKSKNLEKNIKDPIPNYRSQLNWYYFNQPNIKTMNYVVNQLSTILLYIKELKEYKYLAIDFFKYCIQHIKISEQMMSKMNLGRYYANLMKQFKDMKDPEDSIFGDDADVPDTDAVVGDYDSVHPNRDEDPDRVDESSNPDGKDTDLGFKDTETDDADPFSYEHTSFDGLNQGGDDDVQTDDL